MFLVAWAAVLLLVATRPRVARPAVWAIVVVNALWAVDSVVLAATGTLSAVGSAWALLQAVVVAGFAVLGVVGLRRTA